MIRFLCLSLLVVYPVVLGGAPQQGVLCRRPVSATSWRCATQSLQNVPIPPATEQEFYFWRGMDGSRMIAGHIPRKAEVIELAIEREDGLRGRLIVDAPGEAGRMSLEVRPENTTGEALRWEFEPSNDISLAVTGLADRAYLATFAADHHRLVERRIVVSHGAGNFGNIRLQRYPVISGTVVDRDTADPVITGAIYLGDEEAPSAVLAANGEFEVEVVGEWPKYLRVTAARYGTEYVPLPALTAHTVLQPIEMAQAAALIVRVISAEDVGPVDVTLYRVERDDLLRVRSATASSRRDARFQQLAAGKYHLSLSGSESLQQYARVVNLEAGVLAEEDVSIDPHTLQIKVRRNDAGVGPAMLELENHDAGWRANIKTDERGEFTSEFWQSGTFAASAQMSDSAGIFLREDIPANDHTWIIDLPDRRVSGIVTSSVDGKPVQNASVILQTSDANSDSVVKTATDSAGRFEFPFVMAGRQTLTAHADGFLPAYRSFDFVPEEKERTVALSLEAGVRRRVTVVDGRGAPIAGALILDGLDRFSPPIFTDSSGNAYLDIAARQNKTIYVIPREGSFAISQVAGDLADEHVTIQVPPAEGAILIRAQDETMRGISNVSIQIRYNGWLIPPVVQQAMAAYQGRNFTTGAYGKLQLDHIPIGLYELWPAFSRSELERIQRTPGPDAPVRIAVQPGPNAVTLTFARKAGH